MKIVLSLSGGMDSGTMLGYYLAKGHEVCPVNFSYGSKHNKYERTCAIHFCDYYGIDVFPTIDLNFIEYMFESDLLKSGGDIPEGHYEDENMKTTVVPGRNLIFASILAGYAESIDATHIALGVHAGDHHIYSDCRPEFIESLKTTINKSSDGKVGVLAPFLNIDKTQILKIGCELPEEFVVPYQLTRTCYKDQELSCGRCGSCNERLEAFASLGKVDPIKYQK